ncbi:uncharacterized protein K489DRAFT_429095 [Dissoconium aciculare CBS 342.82]|uniref:Uncharacterized protein n=1 Tax=Dissoconium aciculare CBS 342.82 TaxID=1314786 RepID=A0A6J3MFZ0_9PEZI|nr:uncharacterized protein K489DRAFT_429095 [Dissoconium aciculare CBS 342.82]KAF1826778.1 hypothetical protein K489DRAFT_429095 [Dissoconium aciculare CBS 342.82]
MEPIRPVYSFSTRGETPPEVESKTVSWSTLFWIIVPIAFNTMTQPGGSVICAIPEVGFALRSSPLICAVDAILLIYQFWQYSWEHGVKEARRRLLFVRFKAVSEGGSEYPDITLLRENRGFRYVGFALSLVQYVRLYAFSGCTAIQVVATTYLVSFILIEALTLGSRGATRIPPPQVESLRCFGRMDRPYTFIPPATIFAIHIATSPFEEAINQSLQSAVYWYGQLVFMVVAMSIIQDLLSSATQSDAWEEYEPLLLVPVIICPNPGHIVLHIISAVLSVSNAFRHFILVAVPTIWAFFYSLLFSSAFLTRKSAKTRVKGRVEQSASWGFVVLHLAAAFLWHKYSYNPEGTFAPAWTDFLG